MNRKVVGLVACLLPLVFSGVLALTSNEAHHIKDAPDCKVLIEHHCASSHTEVEACLMAGTKHIMANMMRMRLNYPSIIIAQS